MRQLVQVTNPETGQVEWADVSTGETKPQTTRRPEHFGSRVPVGELLFEAEPAIHDKLLNGRALNWNEIARAADVILRAVSQDSLRLMFGASSMKEIRRAIETMLAAQRLCSALNPRLSESGSAAAITPGARKDAQNSMRALLTLPGQK
jgi:hypothetical protein